MVDPLSYFLYQPVLHNWCNKSHGMFHPVCGMVHIKEPLLLIRKSSPCGGSGFPLSLYQMWPSSDYWLLNKKQDKNKQTNMQLEENSVNKTPNKNKQTSKQREINSVQTPSPLPKKKKKKKTKTNKQPGKENSIPKKQKQKLRQKQTNKQATRRITFSP